ncbi:hypothetical protein HD553DRAFT_308666, partial [Filobasidium floriforme]|uniref:uncharacterized protein n=1 Tax=Filobasidium floriforme TaxID=5210 RepID=UPI001E8E2D45
MNSRSHCSARSRSDERPSGSTNIVESVFAQGALHPIVSDHRVMADTSPIFFWRETHPRWGWLSQWYECEFEHDGIVYVTAEMWMMISKAKLFKDEDSVQKMLRTRSPKEHQALGRKVANYDAKIWNQYKEHIVEKGNYLKFTKSKDENMKRKLLETNDRELVEASPVDRIWGVGYSEKDAESNRKDWGQNLLGRAITRARITIKQEEKDLDKSMSTWIG